MPETHSTLAEADLNPEDRSREIAQPPAIEAPRMTIPQAAAAA
jgi:hypothetical protein